MELIQQIRELAVDGSSDVSTLLRRAKVLAATLKNPTLRDWVDHELGGYPDSASIPEYRRIPSFPQGNFSGFGALINDYALPISAMPASLQRNAKFVEARQPIREIAALAAKQSDELRVPWPPEAVFILRDKIKLTGGYQLVEIFQPIGSAQLEAIIDAVRNRLLDLVLALEELAPEASSSDHALGQIPQDAVARVVNVMVLGSQNVVTTADTLAQSVSIGVPLGDLAALLSQLRTVGLDADELRELEAAVQADGPRPDPTFGSRVKEWLGKALTKGVGGAWDITKATVPTLITKALGQYYGWDK
jgi:hypothetical protein